MYVAADATGRVSLRDRANFAEFYVHTDGRGPDLVDADLRRSGAGYIRDGYAWIHTAFLETELAASPGGWESSLAGMIAYARSKGWISVEGRESVRAHLQGVAPN